MQIKSSSLMEKIGFSLIVIGFVFMILNDVWEGNPMPKVMDKNMYFSSIGLIMWAFGNNNRTNKEKNQD